MRASRRASPARTAPRGLGGSHGVLEDADEGIQDAPELVGMGLGEPEVLAHERGGVGEASLDGEEAEQPDHHHTQPLEGLGLLLDHRRQRRGTPPGIVLEQRHQQFVLAREAPVEALERRAGRRHHLGHGEARATGVPHEVACRLHQPGGHLDLSGAGTGQRAQPGADHAASVARHRLVSRAPDAIEIGNYHPAENGILRTGGRQVGDAIGLVIDGGVVPGEAGTYPVTNPVRPAEVVFDAPSASPAQLDRAVAAARAAFPAWAAMAPEERAELVAKAAAAAGAAVEAQDLATLLTREHGKVLWEAQFDSGTIGGMAGAFAPLVAEALGRPGHGAAGADAGPASCTSPTVSWPRCCRSTGRCRSSATRCCPPCWPATPSW